jgi:hypothetical protein
MAPINKESGLTTVGSEQGIARGAAWWVSPQQRARIGPLVDWARVIGNFNPAIRLRS